MAEQHTSTKRRGRVFFWTALIWLALGILFPVVWYVVEMSRCAPASSFCGLGAAYAASYVGIPCCIISCILLIIGLFRKLRGRK